MWLNMDEMKQKKIQQAWKIELKAYNHLWLDERMYWKLLLTLIKTRSFMYTNIYIYTHKY